MTIVAAVLATAVMSAPYAAHASGDGTVAEAAGTRTAYRLAVQPATTTANEQHPLEFRAIA
jgi:crotonobetainyl-CoA:carnitine CoA-transferase CaiB-like acyl-CoA transferase